MLNRFIQPDSIIPETYSPQSWNRYSYVNNRPINLNDPTGHFPTWCGPDNIYCGGLVENNYYSRPAPIKPKDKEKEEDNSYFSDLIHDGEFLIAIGMITSDDIEEIENIMGHHLYDEGGLEAQRIRREKAEELIMTPIYTLLSAFTCFMAKHPLACSVAFDVSLVTTNNYLLPERDSLQDMKNTQIYLENISVNNALKEENIIYITSPSAFSVEVKIEGFNSVIINSQNYNYQITPYLYGRVYNLR